jgi:LmbE family N-acetylglucosaminyl deacetylase
MGTLIGPRRDARAIGFDCRGPWIQRDEAVTRPESILLIAAHPDDEVIGAGSRLGSLPSLTIAHVTDGAPRNMYDAGRYGFGSWADYACARQAELAKALKVLSVNGARTVAVGVPDQEAAYRLKELTDRISTLICDVNPDVILTHPFEGGHPDHDACAFAVHAAVLRLNGPEIFEFACYHAGPAGIRTGEFLQASHSASTVYLTPEEVAMKNRALACFETQRETLALFKPQTERFRVSPVYNFARPPHPGRLYYEQFDWGMTGAHFSHLAARAIRDLAIQETRF